MNYTQEDIKTAAKIYLERAIALVEGKEIKPLNSPMICESIEMAADNLRSQLF